MKKILLLAISAVPASAFAQEEVGIGVGVAARGVVESQDENSRVYNVVEPHLDANLPLQAIRIELRYAPIFYLPMQGEGVWKEQEAETFHVGRGKISTTPMRGLDVWVEDELRAQPKVWELPGDSSENLVQTNEARLAVQFERGRAFVLDALAEGRRFDVFEGVVTELDLDGDGYDEEEDLNEDGDLDNLAGQELRPSFSEARFAPGLFRKIGTTNRVGIVGSVAVRFFDELTRLDHTAVSGGLEARRRVRETISAELRAVGTQYTFSAGQDPLTGYEASTSISWQATRLMGLGVSGAARRAVDSFGNQADTNDVAVSAFRDFARGSRLDLETRYQQLRVLDENATDARDVDAAMGSIRFSFPIRWGVSMNAGYRLWMGKPAGLEWTTDHLAFLGLSWE